MKLLLFLLFPCFLQALPFESQEFAVTGPSVYLKDTAERMYKKGGNVVDIAVASAFTLAVVTPFYVSLGAGGFALVDMGDSVAALDFRETAPQKMKEDYYTKTHEKDKLKNSVLGGSAVGVPGFTAGMWNLHQRYGKLPWKSLFQPAIQLSLKGYRVGAEWVKITSKISNKDYGMKAFFKKEKPYSAGEIFQQKKLAKALKKIQYNNIKGFYQGKAAQDVVQTVLRYGGDMTLKDLKNYKVRWLKPIKKKFMEYNIYSMPPPSSGGLVLSSALELIEQKKLSQAKMLSAGELHTLSEIMSRAFRSRSLIADPDFHKTPIENILSKKYLKEMGDSISKNKVQNLKPLKETTHLAVMDKRGNTVSMTLTLNLNYGSKVVTPAYGIVLNNQMDDFTTKPHQPNSFGLIQGKGNQVQGGKRPLSSMSPTLVKKQGKTIMALGASGGPRIISAVLQVLYRSLVNGLNIDQAIQFPRIHHQFLPRKTYVEKNRFSPDVLKILSRKKHIIEESPRMGKVYGIQKKDQVLQSAFDFRGDGLAWGL